MLHAKESEPGAMYQTCMRASTALLFVFIVSSSASSLKQPLRLSEDIGHSLIRALLLALGTIALFRGAADAAETWMGYLRET